MKKYDFSDFDESDKTPKKYDFSDFENVIEPPVTSEPSIAQTVIDQGLQGLSLGYSDEIGAGLQAAAEIAAGDPTLSDYKDLYNKFVESKREDLKKQYEAHPGVSFASNIAGGLPLAFIPGAAVANTLKGAAILGSIGGYGMSESDTLKGTLSDIGVGAAGGAIAQKLIPLAAATPKAVGKGLSTIGELTERVPILGKGVTALKGSLKGKKYFQNEDEYANELLNEAEKLVNSTKSLSNEVFKNKKKLLEEVKKTGKVADLEKFYDDSIAELENLPGKLTPGFEDQRSAILKDYRAKRFGDKELIPEQVVESKGDYTEIVSNRPELEKQLEKEIIKGKSLGERVSSQIEEVTSPTNEKYLVGKLIKDKDVSPENVRILKPFDFTKREEAERLLQNELLKAKALGEDVVGDLQEIITDSGERVLLPKIIKKSELGTAKDISVLKPIEAVTKTPKTDVTKIVKPSYEKIKDLPKTIQNPSEIEDLIKETRAILDDPNSAQFHAFARQRLKDLQKIQNEMVPGLEQANKESSSVMQLFELLTGKNVHDVTPGFNESDLLKLDLNLAKDTLQKQGTDAFSRIEMKRLLEGFKNTKGLKDISPETAKTVSDIFERSKDITRDLNLAKTVSSDVKPYEAAGLEKASIYTGEKLGSGIRAVSQKALGTVKNVTPEFLQTVALKASTEFGETGKKLANILNSVANKDSQARTAIMFSLMQQPEYREIINKLNPIDTEE